MRILSQPFCLLSGQMLKPVAGVRVRTYCREVGLCLNIHSVAHVHRVVEDRRAVADDIY